MSDKRDREVRKLFSIANSVAMDQLNDDELSELTPHEIFIGSCKMASEALAKEPLPTSYHSPLGNVDRNNIAFVINDEDSIIIMDDSTFEEMLTTEFEDDYED